MDATVWLAGLAGYAATVSTGLLVWRVARLKPSSPEPEAVCPWPFGHAWSKWRREAFVSWPIGQPSLARDVTRQVRDCARCGLQQTRSL